MFFNEMLTNLSVDTHVDNLNYLNDILKKTKVSVSFLGSKQISYNKEVVSLDSLAQKVSDAAKFCRRNGLSELQREQWLAIARNVTNFYEQAAEIGSASYVRLLFIECCGFHNTSSFDLQEKFLNNVINRSSIDKSFRCYSEAAFIELEENMEEVEIDDAASVEYYVKEETICKKAEMIRQSCRKNDKDEFVRSNFVEEDKENRYDFL